MKTRKRLIISLTIILIVLLSSCTQTQIAEKLLENVDSKKADNYLESTFLHLYNNDYESFTEIFEYPMTKEEFNDFVKDIGGELKGSLIDYQLVGYYTHIRNDTTSYEYNYNIQTEEKEYVMQIVLVSKDGADPIYYGLHIYEGQIDDFQPKMIGISIWQIAILIYSLLCWALIILAIVKCAKSKVRLKWLWIIGIIIQNGVSFTKSTTAVQLTTELFRIGISQLFLTHQGNYFSITIVFPIIAVIFLLVKKRLENKKQLREQQLKEQEEELNRISEDRIKNGITRKSEILGTLDDSDNTNDKNLD